ncbi:MAG: hypothetical protein GY754_31080 [bacterium]|nr:hypothetical protein [bacterium]
MDGEEAPEDTWETKTVKFNNIDELESYYDEYLPGSCFTLDDDGQGADLGQILEDYNKIKPASSVTLTETNYLAPDKYITGTWKPIGKIYRPDWQQIFRETLA